LWAFDCGHLQQHISVDNNNNNNNNNNNLKILKNFKTLKEDLKI
jgi:hypothetical protein